MPLLFVREINILLYEREQKGNYEKSNYKMWSTITFERMMIPNHTLFYFCSRKLPIIL